MTFDIHRLLRTFKPEKHTIRPTSRDPSQLRTDSAAAQKRPIVLDTTTYINAGQGKLPPHINAIIEAWPIHHCSVALGEIAHGLGRLDPAHPDTRQNKDFLQAVLEKVPQHRIVNPTDDIHVTGGILTGVIARLLTLPKGAHRNRINDILIYLTARSIGAAVVTANVEDFDILQQLVPDGHVIYY